MCPRDIPRHYKTSHTFYLSVCSFSCSLLLYVTHSPSTGVVSHRSPLPWFRDHGGDSDPSYVTPTPRVPSTGYLRCSPHFFPRPTPYVLLPLLPYLGYCSPSFLVFSKQGLRPAPSVVPSRSHPDWCRTKNPSFPVSVSLHSVSDW